MEEIANVQNSMPDNLLIYQYVKFYRCFPEILDAVSPKSEYLTYLPTKEQLVREIEQQKLIFELQKKED